MSTSTPDWLNEAEAAELIGISPVTLYRRRCEAQQQNEADEGRLCPPFYDYPGTRGVRYRKRDILAFLERHRHDPAQEVAQ